MPKPPLPLRLTTLTVPSALSETFDNYIMMIVAKK